MDRTRRRLLAAAGGAGVAAIAGVLIATDDEPKPRARPASEQRSKGATSRTTDRFGLGDAGIANFLLTVQRVECDFYRRALAGGALRGRALALFERFADQESRHVRRLEHAVAVIGTHTVRAPH